MTRMVRWGAALVAAAVIGAGGDVTTQSSPPPILIVVNSASPNPFGPYLGEILKAEGLNSFSIAQLSAVDLSTLNAARVVILADTPLTADQASTFSNFVGGGGRLVAMHPDEQLLPVLGVTPAGSSTAEGYFAVSLAHGFADGFPTTTLPFHGQSLNVVPASGTQVLATVYSDATTPTAFPAVVRSGSTVTWTYDLARSIVYTRQGDPLNARDRDGSPPYRTADLFYNAIDKDKVGIPYADVQMRMLARAIGDLLANAMPLPRMWYFPGASKTLLVLTGDSHANPQSYFDAEVTAIESHGGRISIYAFNGSAPGIPAVDAWLANGHEFGMHPAAAQNNWTITRAIQENFDWFVNVGYTKPPSPTTRIHQIEWQGWVDAAKIEAAKGIAMDTSFYTWGPTITYTDGSQAHGYINGSGLPMRFIDEAGTIVPVYQQVTSLIDEALVVSDFSEHLTADQAVAVSRQLIDKSQAGDYAAVTTQFHVDYFAFGEVNPWVLGTMDYARNLGIPMWTAERWLRYTTARIATTLTGYSWISPQLQFTATVPAGSESQTIALPGTFDGKAITSISVDGATVAGSQQTVTGRPMQFMSIGPGSHSVVVTYNTPIPPPEHPRSPSTTSPASTRAPR